MEVVEILRVAPCALPTRWALEALVNMNIPNIERALTAGVSSPLFVHVAFSHGLFDGVFHA